MSKEGFFKGKIANSTFAAAFSPWTVGYMAGQSAIKSLNKKKIFFLARSDSWGWDMRDGVKAIKEAEFDLGPAECNELFTEGTLYYFRYVRLFQLKDWARTIRDTDRNARVFDFIHRHARREEDRLHARRVLRVVFVEPDQDAAEALPKFRDDIVVHGFLPR